jgi:hypothetical protein
MLVCEFMYTIILYKIASKQIEIQEEWRLMVTGELFHDKLIVDLSQSDGATTE